MRLEKLLGITTNEKPLDNLVTDGGYTSIFREIVCVGDSLSSGEFEHIDENGKYTFHDKYEYSWGQFIARSTGCKVYNFSRGGMSAKEYMETFANDNNFFDPSILPGAYIIALGLNDIFMLKQKVGSIMDKDLDNDTFASWYVKIIKKYKEINPNANFFFVTIPKESTDTEDVTIKKLAHQKLMYDLTKEFNNSYVIDLYEHAPIVDEDFKHNFYLEGHMNPAGYRLAGVLISSYIDYIIRSNFNSFKQVGFIGTKYYKKELEVNS